jgi:hypothetical protein
MVCRFTDILRRRNAGTVFAMLQERLTHGDLRSPSIWRVSLNLGY